MDFENLPDSSIYLRNLIETLFLFSTVWNLRQGACTFGSLLVADDLVSVPHAAGTILDFAVDVFRIRSPHKRTVRFQIDSASGSRGL